MAITAEQVESSNTLEEFRKEIAKSSNKGPIPTYVVEVLNKNLDEMKEITKPLPQNYNKGSTNSLMRSYKTGRPIKGHPHHGKYGIKE